MKVKLDEGAFIPVRCHKTDAGLDLRSPFNITLKPRSKMNIHTGVHIQLPEDCCGVAVSKSGLMANHDISSTGLVDAGYVGEIVVTLINHGFYEYQIEAGDKISQIVVIPVRYESVELTDKLDESERNFGGFGSTGR